MKQQFPGKVFITGIGTDVGKTVVAAVLAEALRADYWKPIQAGTDATDANTVQKLLTNGKSKVWDEAYKLILPASPHYSAKTERTEIVLEKINVPITNNRLIIEGAGGLMVPLNQRQTNLDLIRTLGVPVMLVARNYLGSINHTLLSIEALKANSINLLGIIYSGDNFLDNEEIIHTFSQVPVLGRIAEAKSVDAGFVLKQAEVLRKSLLNRFDV